MPDLSFRVDRAESVLFAAEPLLALKLHIRNAVEGEVIHSVLLRCQIRIEPTRRTYQLDEQKDLRDLFGEPSRWGQTLRSMLWTHANVMVPSFTGSMEVDLSIPCTFDFNVSATKYFYALHDGHIPLCLLFSGTVFHETGEGELQVAQIPWEKETQFHLPVNTWRQMMDHYYPNSAWLCLQRDTFDRLYRYKIGRGLPTWEQTLESLLDQAEKQVRS